MLAKVLTCAVVGLEGAMVEVEVDISPGLPVFTIVGLPGFAGRTEGAPIAGAVPGLNELYGLSSGTRPTARQQGHHDQADEHPRAHVRGYVSVKRSRRWAATIPARMARPNGHAPSQGPAQPSQAAAERPPGRAA